MEHEPHEDDLAAALAAVTEVFGPVVVLAQQASGATDAPVPKRTQAA